MNTDTPFNPIPLPEGLLLIRETDNPPPPPARDPGMTQAKELPVRKRKARRRKANCDAGPEQSRWQRIKGRLTARLCQMDPETLKRILTAAGVAAGVIAAILLAIKFAPLALVLLLILGIAWLLRIWDRLRHWPRAF